MRITFRRPLEGARYTARFVDDDGLLVELDGGAYNRVGGPHGRVPHDLAHLVVEQALALPDGVWGLLARGGRFDHAAVIEGRRRPHAERRSAEILRAAGDGPARSEAVVHRVCDLAATDRWRDLGGFHHATDPRWRVETSADALAAACGALRAAAEAWARIAPGGTLDADWCPPRKR